MEDDAKRKDVAQQRSLAPTYRNFSILPLFSKGIRHKNTLVTLNKQVSAWLDSICNTSYSLLGVTEVLNHNYGVKRPTTMLLVPRQQLNISDVTKKIIPDMFLNHCPSMGLQFVAVCSHLFLQFMSNCLEHFHNKDFSYNDI